MGAKTYIEERVAIVPWSGCWLWELSIGNHGYGNARWGGKTQTAHRLSYRAFVGEIPDDAFVLHSCDVKSCVNPDHLKLGTHAENMDDMARRCRHSRRRKLTIEQVDELKRLGGSVPQRVLARRFGVTQRAVWSILHGLSRRHE